MVNVKGTLERSRHVAWGEEPAKNPLCLIPLLEPETRAEEPAAALSIT